MGSLILKRIITLIKIEKNLFRDTHVFGCTSVHPAKARMLKILYMFNAVTQAFSLWASEWLSHLVTYDATKHLRC